MLDEGDIVNLVRAGQPDTEFGVPFGAEHALHQVKTQHLGEYFLNFSNVRTVQQAMVQAYRRNSRLALMIPRRRVDGFHAITHGGFFSIELDQVAGGQFETHPLPGLQHFTSRDTLSLQAIGLQVGIKLLQRGMVQYLETEEVDTGGIRFTDDIAVVVPFIPAFEVHATLIITSGFHQTQHVAIEMDAFFKIQHPHLGMPRA